MRGGQRLIVELEARLRESSGIAEPEAPLHARLRLVHRGDARARRQGARRVAAQADGRHGRALHVRRPRRARRQAGPRRGARGGARGRALRARWSAISPRSRSGCAPSRRAWRRGTSRARSPRWPTATTGCARRSTTRSSSSSRTRATPSSRSSRPRAATCPTTCRSARRRGAPAPVARHRARTWRASRPSCGRRRSA